MSDDLTTTLQPRIRHITSIQIRNLSPFPTRDVAASALTLPAELSQFNSHGQLADDSDAVLSRRRSRKISLNSLSSVKTLKSDTGEPQSHNGSPNEARGRKAKSFGVGSPVASLDLDSPSRHNKSSSGSAPTIRPRRPRTTSTMSASSISITLPGAPPSTAVVPVLRSGPLSAMLPDHSQLGLEKVISSRLVETFLAITVPPSHRQPEPTPVASSSRPSTPLSSPPMKDRPRSLSKQSKPPNGILNKKDAVYVAPSANANKSVTISPRKPSFSPTIRQTNGRATDSAHHRSSSTITRTPSASTPSVPPVPTVPNFLSDIHRPSTTPVFYLDRMADWTDMSSDRVNIQVWAKFNTSLLSNSSISVRGKGKEKQRDPVDSETDWKVLLQWDVDLSDLAPLPTESAENSHLLPPNTLVFYLSPPGGYFYIPPPSSKRDRSYSPSLTYNSDPETEAKKLDQIQAPEFNDGELTSPLSAHDSVTHSRRRHRKGTGRVEDDLDEPAKTASWQDIFKLVSLQSTLVDTKTSLDEIIANIDKSVESTEALTKLTREVSERTAWVDGLRQDSSQLEAKSKELRQRILARRQALDERRNNLALAREQLKDDIIAYSDKAMEVTEEEHRLVSLRAQLQPLRTSLISTLASIFPIELLSPPDLLYTILDVPLPIPLTNTDPAPPLSLPNFKDINEDVVATSLGYSAQVVHLLAAYLGKGLVYPVTCIGSRSLIRDGISTMVGPRMFPLFSRGVDTYRFEYGVFLLNKNIEMLMVDRELRPVDMRHTLPNLKNLLLTLTSCEEPLVRTMHRPPSSVMSISSLESPRPESPQLPDVDATASNGGTTPKANKHTELPVDNTTPPASGASTPTTSSLPTDAEKKARPSYLSLAPFSSFLRSRLPSTTLSKPTAKEVFDRESSSSSSSSHVGENGVAGGPSVDPSGGDIDQARTSDGDVDHEEQMDEEDRKTLRGVPIGLGLSGIDHGRSTQPGPNEKADALVPLDAPPTPQPPQPVQ